MYDAEVGVWLAPDPMEQFWNTYSYTGADPVNSVDPDGMWSWKKFFRILYAATTPMYLIESAEHWDDGQSFKKAFDVTRDEWWNDGQKHGSGVTIGDGEVEPYYETPGGRTDDYLYDDIQNANVADASVDQFVMEAAANPPDWAYDDVASPMSSASDMSTATVGDEQAVIAPLANDGQAEPDDVQGSQQLACGPFFMLFSRPYSLFSRPPQSVQPGMRPPTNPSGPLPEGFQPRVNPKANYFNPRTGESLRPDFNHKPPIKPHWDYRDPGGQWYRWFFDGTLQPKSLYLEVASCEDELQLEFRLRVRNETEQG